MSTSTLARRPDRALSTVARQAARDRVISRLQEAEKALMQATRIDQTKLVLDAAEAQRVFAKRQQLGEDVIGYATAIKMRALSRLGELLRKIPKATGTKGRLSAGPGRGNKNGSTDLAPPFNDAPTLAELGIDKKTSAIAQQLAALPVETREAIAQREDTLTKACRRQKESTRESRREVNREKVAQAQAAHARLVPGVRFATIVADPPWDWGDEGDDDQMGRARPTYATLTIADLLDLKADGIAIADLADIDCHLYLWITNRSLPKGFALLERWGFRYVTCLTWCKPSIGMGNYFRGSTEHVLFGVKGSQALKRRDVGTWFAADREGPHSTKPAALYALIEACSPGPYVELFGRGDRGGDWIVWGADV